MDLDPLTIKAVWGFNGTERPGAVYLAAVMAAHAQRGLPAFSIYGHDVHGSVGHAHGLNLQPLPDAAPAAVDDRTNADFRIGHLQIFLSVCRMSFPLTPYGTPSTQEVPDAIAPYLAEHDVMLLQNHGALTNLPFCM